MTNMKINITQSFENYKIFLGSYHLLCVTMETRGTPFQNACFEFNKYLLSVKFTQLPDCNTEQKKV